MSLSVGIVGLPNAGKSTLFNALASRRLAETAPRPFTTIEPHETVVGLPDQNLEKLHNILVSQYPNIQVVPATVTFIDIAGLVKGAHEGEGLGNQFLGHIREVDALVHVVRAFEDPGVTHQHATYEPGTVEQVLDDIEVVNIELELGGITAKPVIYVLNVDEDDLNNMELIARVEEKFKEKALLISAKLEEEFIDLSKEERAAYLGSIKPGLDRLILFAYSLLNLITFYTIKGGQEVHAWSIKNGASAIDAAGTVHTDFAKGFIKAEVITVNQLLEVGGWKEAGEKGKLRLEGRDYLVQDEDVIEFKVAS